MGHSVETNFIAGLISRHHDVVIKLISGDTMKGVITNQDDISIVVQKHYDCSDSEQSYLFYKQYILSITPD